MITIEFLDGLSINETTPMHVFSVRALMRSKNAQCSSMESPFNQHNRFASNFLQKNTHARARIRKYVITRREDFQYNLDVWITFFQAEETPK